LKGKQLADDGFLQLHSADDGEVTGQRDIAVKTHCEINGNKYRLGK